MQIRRYQNRRGITLLFVVSMIVLFLLMGTTFVVVSNDYLTASRKRARKDVKKIDGTAFVERAFYELVRGPELDNTTSPLRGQSILADMYGYGFTSFVVSSSAVDADIPGTRYFASPVSSNGQLIELQLESSIGAGDDGGTFIRQGNHLDLADKPGEYNGQIMTFVSGPAAGISSRIVDYQIDVNSSGMVTARKFIIAPNLSDSGTFALSGLNNAQVVVNRRAFGGVGAGRFNPAAPSGVAALGGIALDPNRAGDTRAVLTDNATGYLGNDNGPNESYDAPDFQNMFLSGFDATNAFFGSFWRASLAGNGGFEEFDMNAAGMEVDTNNDGVNDSIWMDTGMPVQTNGDGFYYKPLVAYYVTDLDARLNLNTVGNLSDMLNAVQINDMGTPGDRTDDMVVYNPPAYAGQGYGPAEISPANFLGLGQRYIDNGNVVGNTNMDYEKILMGDFTTGIPGRYGFGADGIAGTRVSTTPLIAGDEVPGAAGRDDWSTQKLFGLPTGVNTVGGLYASSPLDIRGRFAVGTFPTSAFPDLNDGATFNNSLPATDFSIAVAADDTLSNSPYESNFAPSPFNRWEVGDDDLPFQASELERMLRPFDVDSNLLPTRLTQLAPTVFADLDKRTSITTDSYEVPMVPVLALNDANLTTTLLDLLRNKIQNDSTAGNPYMGLPDFDPTLDQYIREILSPEIMVGMKMDVNRLFGNGYDDNSNFVKDDYNETGIQRNLDQTGMPGFDIDNNFVVGGNDEFARVKFARQLYILMLLVAEDNLAAGTLPVEDYRRAVAQWAINVVDFRDQDSINTPFEYDVNPWNGWDAEADGIFDPGETAASTGATGDRRIVWGAERPELLITETFAHHDRATEDLSSDPSGDDIAGGDTDYDSRLVPRSSAFIELYHPWTQNLNSQILPAELARTPGAPIGVDLQAVSPNDEPVWRIAMKRDPADMNFIRAIYFADYTANPWTVTDIAGDQFFTTFNLPVVEPGMFAVVGSAGTRSGAPGGEYPTTIGRRATAVEGDATTLQLDETRTISLEPSANPTDPQIVRIEWDGAAMSRFESRGIAVVIDGPRSLSISDPDGGYPANDPDGLPRIDVIDGQAYSRAYDIPLDETLHPDANDETEIWTNGTTDAFRTVYLQRLANPLQAWDANSNPYISVDIAPIDLMAFNGTLNEPTNEPRPDERDPALGMIVNGETAGESTERGETQMANTRMLFAREYGEAAADGIASAGDQHNLSFELVESFGRTNDAYLMNGPMDYYAWLTWNNRPFVSQYELANVPFVSQEDLTTAFSLYDETQFTPANIFNGDKAMPVLPSSVLASAFGHLLNFHGHDDTANTPNRANFYRLFDYTEVPSRYVGTEMWLNSADFTNYPHNFISHYRYPGKLNINTISNAEVYNALMGNYASQLNFGAFNASRWDGAFFRPYRNSGEGNFVPPGVQVEEGVDCGLFRRNTPGDNLSLFDFTNTTLPYLNASRSAYFRNAMRQRLGNLVTTRSSVFAIWITVGYFECDINGNPLTDAMGNGLEVGAETGEIKRNRGFYIFDRSIPMAFEPGKNHNVERGILVQSMIE